MARMSRVLERARRWSGSGRPSTSSRGNKRSAPDLDAGTRSRMVVPARRASRHASGAGTSSVASQFVYWLMLERLRLKDFG